MKISNFGRYRIVFLVLFALLTQANKCGDNIKPDTFFERVEALRVFPNPFFEEDPEFKFPKTFSSLGENNTEPFLNKTSLIDGPAYVMQAGMVIVNEGSENIEDIVLNIFVKDPSKYVLGLMAGVGFLGKTFSFVPSPAMLDENEPVYFGEGKNVDPYPGYMGFVALGPLKTGAFLDFTVLYGAGVGTLIHFEAVGLIKEKRWAVPLPDNGTTISLSLPKETNLIPRPSEMQIRLKMKNSSVEIEPSLTVSDALLKYKSNANKTTN